jgi:hypothetical protein
MQSATPVYRCPSKKKLEGKAVRYIEFNKSSKGRLIQLAKLLSIIAVLGTSAFFVSKPWFKKQYVRNELLPAIEKLGER